ncbi:MAG TPA: divalent-cation tolerance protein CutA [Ilumatobacteraceae bacterium]|nr:divalent-cation tolerance protein CutA [Ilumatobacteraceae bacterium]
MEPVEVTVTCASAEEASTIGRQAVERRIAACAQRWPITSCYRWEGEVVEDEEWLLLLKSSADHFDAICALVGELHSYELPGIVMLPVAAVGFGYEAWLRESTAG